MRTGSSLRFGLSHEMRLKDARDFVRLRETGKRLVCGCLVINWQVLPAGSVSRLGTVTSRKLGGAVVRNRARRLMREVFRRNRHCLSLPADVILVARASIVGRDYAAVEKDFQSGLQRMGLCKADETGRLSGRV